MCSTLAPEAASHVIQGLELSMDRGQVNRLAREASNRSLRNQK